MSALLDEMFGPDPARIMCRCGHSSDNHYFNGGNCQGAWVTPEGGERRYEACHCRNFAPKQPLPDHPSLRGWWRRYRGRP